MSTQPELLACPFCGSRNIDAEGWATLPEYAKTPEERSGPACDDCGATAPSVAIWNDRCAVAQQTSMSDDEAMRRLSANELACYRWPMGTVEHRAMRAAFMDGAAITPAQCAPQPSGDPVVTDEMVDRAIEAHEELFDSGDAVGAMRAALIAAFHPVSCAAREAVKSAIAGYADSYRSMAKMGDGKVQCRSVEADLLGPITQSVLAALPAADGEASKREAEIVERHAKLAESLMHSDLTPGRVGLNIAAAIRASLRKDG